MRFPAPLTLLAAMVTLSVAAATVLAEIETLDDGTDPARWQVVASDGVTAAIEAEGEGDRRALRLDFDFTRGSGFVVARLPVDLTVPTNYRFRVDLWSDAQANDLEFKLLDPSQENVWWVKRRAFEFPREWKTETYRKRHFRFAWGPSGGAPLERISAIEIAIAAATGGKGSLHFDNLTLERLPEPAPATQPATANGAAWDESQPLVWRSAASAARQSLTIDFGRVRELGGLQIDWQGGSRPTRYVISAAADGDRWERLAEISGSNGGRDYVPLPDAESRHVRIDVVEPMGDWQAAADIATVRILPPEFAASPNTTYAGIGTAAPRGRYPRYFLGEQTYWTVIGRPGDFEEALIDEFGAIEPYRGGFRIEPFLWIDGRLFTWDDVQASQSLLDGYLPIPRVSWMTADVELEITALAPTGTVAPELFARYRVRNLGLSPRRISLVLAVRPFQVLPPWHELNLTGGVARIDSIALADGAVRISPGGEIRPSRSPSGFGVAGFAEGDIVEYLAAGNLPAKKHVEDSWRRAAAALRFDIELAAGADDSVVLSLPLSAAAQQTATGPSQPRSAAPDASRFDDALAATKANWLESLNRVQLSLPPAAQRLVDTFRTTQAYLLINADGPGLQPGSRTYERSWIRDGALSSTALLYTGHTDTARAFLDWFAPYQYENGKVPCVVDRRGPDPVPEHDSTGELIYALHNFYRFTRDRGLLRRHFDRVSAGVGYLESLRAQRMTPEFRDGPPEKRVLYGLVTESISHEGYSAKAMHSYWDSFWTVRGLKDAAAIARAIGRNDEAQQFAALRDDYRASLYASIKLAMQNKGVEYIPGCAELGDFDATSTSTGVFPCGEQAFMPQPALTNTFDRYLKFFRDRRDGRTAWRDYTPYEIRIVSTLIQLGQSDAAHELLDYFFQDQRPAGWNHWAEVVHCDPLAPRFVGDMPHTWVGAEFTCGVRTMFVYEREDDESVVLTAGVRQEWLEHPGVQIGGFPTEYGKVSYTLRRAGPRVELALAASGALPPGGFVLRPAALGCAGATIDGEPATLAANGEFRVRALLALIVFE